MLLVPNSPLSVISRSSGVEVGDVFSTTLYAGNGTDDRDITNGIDLSGEGGMVWIKNRDAPDQHILVDTERGATKYLRSESTSAETTDGNVVQAFNSDGFQIGTSAFINTNTEGYVAWAFRKAAGFFDVVTYTGNATNRTISHSLGAVPGMIIVKRTDSASPWGVYHRSNTANPETDYLYLNTTAATVDFAGYWNDTAPTDSVFSIGTDGDFNTTSAQYVAYLFGHDADGIIQCGSYTGNGSSTGPTISLGWEPQWVLIKQSDGVSSWGIWDSARSTSNTRDKILKTDLSNAEQDSSVNAIDFNATSFQLKNTNSDWNSNTETYIYVAIKAE